MTHSTACVPHSVLPLGNHSIHSFYFTLDTLCRSHVVRHVALDLLLFSSHCFEQQAGCHGDHGSVLPQGDGGVWGLCVLQPLNVAGDVP